jgi:hypothetical protein
LIRVDYHGAKEVPTGTCEAILEAAGLKPGETMIALKYSLVIGWWTRPSRQKETAWVR